MKEDFNIKFKKALDLLSGHFPASDESSRKPVLDHCVRVGSYLYENGYSDDIVISGLLHDLIEQAKTTTEKTIRDNFGDRVLELVLASTKDYSISDSEERNIELIKRCISFGEDALIVKSADILDSFEWYYDRNNENELKYCESNADAILKYKPDDFDDKIFDKIKDWKFKIS